MFRFFQKNFAGWRFLPEFAFHKSFDVYLQCLNNSFLGGGIIKSYRGRRAELQTGTILPSSKTHTSNTPERPRRKLRPFRRPRPSENKKTAPGGNLPPGAALVFYPFTAVRVSLPSLQSTTSRVPGAGSSAIISRATIVSTLDWMNRFRGRAPYTGS